MTLLAGGANVMLEFARLLPENLKGPLFTVSPLVALEVTHRSTVEVILLAGRLSRKAYICTGASVVRQLIDIRADLCVMAPLKSAEKTASLSIAEKKDIAHRLRICALHEIDYLITERPPSDELLSDYSAHCRRL